MKNNKKMIAFRAEDDLRATLKKMANNFHLSESEVIRRSLSLTVKHLHQPVVHNHFMKRGVL